MNAFLVRQNETVIVIDPGHGGLGGGADDGAMYNGVTERYINMATARAMYDELSKYEDVRVYLTHDDANTAMTLKERAEFAKSVNADCLISIHYNASESHLFYGSEVWIPSIGGYYAEGYKLADLVIEQFRNMGLHIRGIKTRVGDGNDEYYGIIRECEWRGITSVIIEHCHVDNLNDIRYFNSEDNYVEFGKADALAAAKYFGLKSTVLGVDYSSYRNAEVPAPSQRVYQDTTPPDKCELSLSKEIAGNGSIEFTVEGIDNESSISYYSCSFDGGNTYSDLFEWRDSDGDNREDIIISNISMNDAELVVRIYNNYNLFTDSNTLSLRKINGIDTEPARIVEENPTADNSNNRNSEQLSLETQTGIEEQSDTETQTGAEEQSDTETQAGTEIQETTEMQTTTGAQTVTETLMLAETSVVKEKVSDHGGGRGTAAAILLVVIGLSAVLYRFGRKSRKTKG